MLDLDQFFADCQLAVAEQKQEQKTGPVDLSAMSSMLASKWKGGGAGASSASDGASKADQVRTGQIRSFRISKLDAEKKRIDLELVS